MLFSFNIITEIGETLTENSVCQGLIRGNYF